MSTIRRLSKMPYANAAVIIDPNGCIFLKSYETIVIAIDELGNVQCFGLYSSTTRHHIAAFMNEYCAPLNYYSAKDAYLNNYRINYITGEVLPL